MSPPTQLDVFGTTLLDSMFQILVVWRPYFVFHFKKIAMYYEYLLKDEFFNIFSPIFSPRGFAK
jgi:hypothetical protein